MDEIAAYLGFSYCLGIGPVKFQALLNTFGTAEKAYRSSRKDLSQVIGIKTAEKFIVFRQTFRPDLVHSELRKKNITALPINSDQYPQMLTHISDPPICLYVKGDIRKISLMNQKSFGIVGTRKPTDYGAYVASLFSSGLASSGIVIISGLAYGIDAVAHKACIKAGGKTIAVLGCGVDIAYPYANKDLYDNIIDGNGFVVSEFPPGMTVQKGLFVARNRIISGLSKGIMVVEGEKDSGSLITARYAAEQGKDVFCPPVPLNSSLSEAPNILLREGARLVFSPYDVLEEYGVDATRKELYRELVGEQKEIYDAVKMTPLSLDELSIQIQKPTHVLTQLISYLEVGGIVKRNEEGKYCV